MTQAIQTRILSATNTKGTRVKATAWAGSVTVPYDHSLTRAVEQHAKAARALVEKLGWSGTYVAGGMPDGSGDSYVWVSVKMPDSVFTVTEGE